MDNCSHFKWELTRDELDTIWWAVTEREDRLFEKAKNQKDPEQAQLSRSLAVKCRDLRMQINRMRNRYW